MTVSIDLRRPAPAIRTQTLASYLEMSNPAQRRFPWKPSTTMLTYRLSGTTEDSGSTTTNTSSLNPPPGPMTTAEPDAPGKSFRAPWCAEGAVLLTCGFTPIQQDQG